MSKLSGSVVEYKRLIDGLSASSSSDEALRQYQSLKQQVLEVRSLPPFPCDISSSEYRAAKEFYEYSVLLAVIIGDKELFQVNYDNIKMYRNDNIIITGLYLLYLLVDNKLSQFHCELELLTDEQLNHPNIIFCTQLDQHLMVGSYDQVMNAAAKPPVTYYHFFLKSLLETVRLSVAECLNASTKSIALETATKALMFESNNDTLQFINDYFAEWTVNNNIIYLDTLKVSKSEGIPSLKVIYQTLKYATELERIV